MKVGGFFCAPGAPTMTTIQLMSTRKIPAEFDRSRVPNREAHRSPHDFHNGFIPQADRRDDHIIVTRNSPLISAVSRAQPGKYRIWGGSFIGGGGSSEASADQAANFLARSPHWAHLMRLTLELGWKDVHEALGKL
jgi:hypothetical protein